MLKLKLQYFGHLMRRTDSLEKPWCWERLMAGGEGDGRWLNGWVTSPTQWTWVWVSSSSWWWTGKPGILQSMGSQRGGHDWVTELNWIEALQFSPWIYFILYHLCYFLFKRFSCRILIFRVWQYFSSSFKHFLLEINRTSKYWSENWNLCPGMLIQ